MSATALALPLPTTSLQVVDKTERSEIMEYREIGNNMTTAWAVGRDPVGTSYPIADNWGNLHLRWLVLLCPACSVVVLALLGTLLASCGSSCRPGLLGWW